MFCMRNITGNQIQKVRKSKNLTQEELAVKLQIQGFRHTRSTIAKIENGFRQITDLELKVIADVLETSVICFFEET